MLKVITGFITLILLNACSVTTPHTAYEDKAPSWYYNQPQDDMKNLYAMAEDKTKKQAISKALNKINNKFKIKVEKNYNEQINFKANKQNIDIEKNNIEEYTYPLEITNYEVISTFKRQGNIVVLLKLEKQKYQRYISKKVKKEIKKLKKQEKSIENSNIIKKSSVYDRLNLKTYELQAYIDVYHKMSGFTPRLAKEARYIRILRENYEEIQEQKKLSIYYEGNSRLIKKEFEKYLSENKYLIKRATQPLNIVLNIGILYEDKKDLSTYFVDIVIKEYDLIIKQSKFKVLEKGNIQKSRRKAKKEILSYIKETLLK